MLVAIGGINAIGRGVLDGVGRGGRPLVLVQQFLASLSGVGFTGTKLVVAMFTRRVVRPGKVILVHKGLKVALTPFLTVHAGNLGDLKMLVAIGGINSVRRGVLDGVGRGGRPLVLVQQFLASLSSVGFARTKLAVAMLTSRVASSGKVILGHKGLKVALTPFLTMHTGNLGDLEILVAIGGINT